MPVKNLISSSRAWPFCRELLRTQFSARRRVAYARGHSSASQTVHYARRIAIFDRVNRFSWNTLSQVASLLSAAFYEDEDAWQRGTAKRADEQVALGAALFGWASVLAVLLQHLSYGDRHLTMLAFADEQVVGCCGLTLEAMPDDVAAATGTTAGALYGLLTGLAVAPVQRRRGVASELLEAAAAVAVSRLPLPATLALLVARTNTAALRLYKRQGYEEQATWVDARWQAEAERGKVGKPRRLLLTKRLGTARA